MRHAGDCVVLNVIVWLIATKDVKQNIKSWRWKLFFGLPRSFGILPETPTLFHTKICDFPYPISDLNPDNTVGVNIKREMILSPNVSVHCAV